MGFLVLLVRTSGPNFINEHKQDRAVICKCQCCEKLDVVCLMLFMRNCKIRDTLKKLTFLFIFMVVVKPKEVKITKSVLLKSSG